MKTEKTIWQKSREELLQELDSTPEGLTGAEAARRLEQYGPNELQEGGRKSVLRIFLEQFADFLVIILILAAVVSAILGGHVTANWCNPSEADAQIEAGNMKALAVAGDAKVEAIPEAPTTVELGYDQIQFQQYRGILATKNMPDENIEKLVEALEVACQSDEFQTNYLDVNCLVGDFRGPEEFAQVIDDTWEELQTVIG